MTNDLPPMPELLRPLAEDAFRRLGNRTAPPDIVTKPEQRYLENLTCPYRDEDAVLWTALVLDCFGTRTQMVGQAFFRQLEALCPRVLYDGEDETRRDEESLRQALAIVYSLKPRTEVEGALAAQAVALHFASMKIASYIGRHDYVEPRNASALAQVTKAFALNLESLGKLRGKSATRHRMTVRHEKHVHHHQHVHFEGGGQQSGGQPQGPIVDGWAATDANGAEVHGSGQVREALPSAANEGKAGVPIAWRGKSRRTEGTG